VGLNRERGITVLMVTHEPDMAAYASRTIRFRDGHVESDERTGGVSAERSRGVH
jgi:putative ABC transport system ATP-binding protein